MLNDTLVQDLAQALAGRIATDGKAESVRRAYRLVLGREASVEEVGIAGTFLADQSLDRYCLALFNLNEFVYLD